ncbi:MAG: nitroreductase family deazaflavin-dependent oxidoreductase [Acidobacteriota bacterium]|nr:MAG: nitroreductase family deazaflavin-dependent oxidoreductase [Acidobacteriota bacterium]
MLPESHPNRLQRYLQKAPASKTGSAFFARTLHYIDRNLMKATGGRFSLPGILAGIPVVTVTTTGVKTGQPRTVPLVAFGDGEKVILIASNWGQKHHPAWYLNLRADPHATVSVDGRNGRFIAREAGDDERDKYWEMAYSLYFGFRLYRQRAGDRKIPIMILEPDRST